MPCIHHIYANAYCTNCLQANISKCQEYAAVLS